MSTLAQKVHGRRNRHPFVTALSALALTVAGLVLVPASPAAAAENTLASVAPVTEAVAAGMNNCPSPYVCFWVNAYYQGAMGKLAGDNQRWDRFSQSQCPHGTWEDCASSTYNHSPVCTVSLWTDRYYLGGRLWERPGSHRDNLAFNRADDGQPINDRISSNSWWC